MSIPKVFIADDDEIFLAGTIDLFQRLGYTIDSVRSVNEALFKLDINENDWSLAVVDLLMPMEYREQVYRDQIRYENDAANGLKVVQQIKQKMPWLGIIVVTSYRWLFEHIVELWAQGFGRIVGVEKGASIAIYREALETLRIGESRLFCKDRQTPLVGATKIFLSMIDTSLIEQVTAIAPQLLSMPKHLQRIVPLIAWKPKYIAEALSLSIHAVQTYKDDIYEYLDLRKREEHRDTLIFLASIYAYLSENDR